MEIELLNKVNWDYLLFKVGENLVITVTFFGQIDYPRSFTLNQDEQKIPLEGLSELSEEIRNNYTKYQDREIIPPITKGISHDDLQSV